MHTKQELCQVRDIPSLRVHVSSLDCGAVRKIQLSLQTLASLLLNPEPGQSEQTQLLRQKAPGLTTTFPCITHSVPKDLFLALRHEALSDLSESWEQLPNGGDSPFILPLPFLNHGASNRQSCET